jgi:D-alanyl-lipoteichoic acid acyltransferase DltB (MBOAT superfamily)
MTPRLAAVLGYLGTFTICGLWHGPTLNFGLWGFYHGVLLSGYALYATSRMRRPLLPAPIGHAVSVGGTFLAVTYGWVFFTFAAPKALSLTARLVGMKG